MGGYTSILNSLSTSTAGVTATFAQKGIIQPRRRIFQNYLLIWLDAHIDESKNDCQNTLKQLRNIVNDINLFTDPDQCAKFLNQIDEERAFIIISGALGQHLVPVIHGMTHVDTIYIFCNSKEWHQQWAKDWPKVKSVYDEITPICEALKQAVKRCNQDYIPISFVSTTSDESSRNLDELEPSFMYTQIFKEILFDVEYGVQSVKQLAVYCSEKYVDNVDELDVIQQFAREYCSDTSIFWYTRECFTFQMLNRALRTLESDTIMKMGFFIRDLHLQIEKLHQAQFGKHTEKAFIVYRGQGLSSQDFAKLQKTKGGLMSFNNFLSTSRKQEVSLDFAKGALTKSETVGILFKMTIDPSISSAPFAVIDKVSIFKEEQEVLFSMHTIFRIGEIKTIDNNDQLCQVELELTADSDSQLRALTEQIRQETFPNQKGWYRMGELLIALGQFDKAEQIYSMLLEETTGDKDKANIFHQLGSINNGQGVYEKAISYYCKVLEIDEKTHPPNHPDLAASHNNIGSVYNNMGEYSKALLSYGTSLQIIQRILPRDHPSFATSYSNIGLVYNDMGEYSNALSYHEKSFEIRQKALLNHPSLASSYNNIGLVHNDMGEYSKALSSHEKALEIRERVLPSNHPDLAQSYNNMGSVYNNMGEYLIALSCHEKSREIRQKALPSNHPSLASSYNSLGLVYNNMGEYLKALSYHEKSFEIRQTTLPPNLPDLAQSHNNMDSVYNKMGQYSRALSSYKNSLEIREKVLPQNHPSLASSYNNIGSVYNKMRKYSTALSYYEKSFAVRKKVLSPNHPDLAASYNNIGLVYNNMGKYLKALPYHEQSLEIRQKTLPPNHPDLAQSYNNIGEVYSNIGKYSKALPFLEDALNIKLSSLPSGHPSIENVRQRIEVVKKKL